MVFQRVESINDIKLVHFVAVGGRDEPAFDDFIARFHLTAVIYHTSDEAVQQAAVDHPDIIFIGPFSSDVSKDKCALCQRLRDAGHLGVIILLTNDIISFGGTGGVTAAGFDHYLQDAHLDFQIEDSINWALLNRRRKNKYQIQFDRNPDAFFTLNPDGRVFDINQWGSMGSGLTPRKIVVGAINIRDLGTLNCFDEIIRPVITEANVGNTHLHTYNEGVRIFQIKTNVHNVPMIGLVATVIKTDITETMYERSMDILLHSVTLLSERDHYTAGHSSRVFHYCKLIVETMDISGDKEFLRDLYFAALLHDIGKIGVRDDILLKEGDLTDDEFSILATHPEKGYKVLNNYEFLQGSTQLVLYHHVRPDGMGYPQKLDSGHIPLGASIISVADGFDAMTTNRPYRSSLSFRKAVGEISENMGTQYEKEVARAFLSRIRESSLMEVKAKSSLPLAELSRELIETLL